MKKEKLYALIRIVVALAAAVALLAATGFGFVPLMKGPTAITDGQELADADYVSADLTYMMTICGEELRGEETVAYYAIAPIGNRFVVLRFDAALLEDINTLTEATESYLGGESRVMTVHMPVKGMTEPAADEVFALLSEWFESNKDWMNAAGVVGAEPTAEEYLAEELVRVDNAGRMSGEYTVVLSVIAALLALYALVELLFMLLGGKKEPKKAEKKSEKKAEKKPEIKLETAAVAAAAVTEAEEAAEEAAEADEEIEEAAEEIEEAEEELEEADEVDGKPEADDGEEAEDGNA